MTSPVFITKNNKKTSTQGRETTKTQRICEIFLSGVSHFLNFAFLRLCTFALIFFVSATAQKVAVLSPDASDASRKFAEKLEMKLGEKIHIVDGGMSAAAFSSTKLDEPFNMTAASSKTLGKAIGCDFFVLVKSETLRRNSSKKGEYYESYAAIYAVSSRSGRLVFWRLLRFDGTSVQDSQSPLNDSVGSLTLELTDKVRAALKSEMTEPPTTVMEEMPDEGPLLIKSFRAPVPYRRIKPEYTADAFLNSITATVDIFVDLDARGTILKTEIVRWAGYGLDESVEKAVRSMNWRPAERNGKPLPMRFLLRYNFRKIEKE